MEARINISDTLFSIGRPEDALAQLRVVLEREPENRSALSHLIRFRVLTGRTEEAQALWERLRRTFTPEEEPLSVVDVAAAAAALEQDKQVYDLLRPLYPRKIALSEHPSADDCQALSLLAAAAANLGHREEARRC